MDTDGSDSLDKNEQKALAEKMVGGNRVLLKLEPRACASSLAEQLDCVT
jgi:hypothetical protein